MILFVLLNEVFRYFFSTHSTSNSHESIINVIGQLDVLDLKREESYQRTKNHRHYIIPSLLWLTSVKVHTTKFNLKYCIKPTLGNHNIWTILVM